MEDIEIKSQKAIEVIMPIIKKLHGKFYHEVIFEGFTIVTFYFNGKFIAFTIENDEPDKIFINRTVQEVYPDIDRVGETHTCNLSDTDEIVETLNKLLYNKKTLEENFKYLLKKYI